MSRDIHVVTADVLYKHKSLKLLLPQIGAIKVRRDDHDFAFLKKVEKLLNKKRVCLFFPESYINGIEKNKPLMEFKSSYILPALQTSTPIIPVATNGIYRKNRKKYNQKTKIMIGKPINVNALWSENKSVKENIIYINKYIKDKIQ